MSCPTAPRARRALVPAALLLVAACHGGDRTRSLDGRLVCDGCLLDAEGGAVVDFGLVAVGRSAERALRLRNAGAGPMRVEILPVTAPFGTATPPTVHLEPQQSFDLELYYAPEREGDAAFELDLGVTSGSSLRVHLRGRSEAPRIECNPSSLDFGNVVVGSSVVRELTCRNLSTELPAELVTTIATPYRIADETTQLSPGEQRTIPIAFRPTAPGPALRETTVGSRGMTPQPLQLLGEAIATGLVIEPPPGADGCHDLGEVLPGQESRKRLSLTNVGDVPIWVQQVTISRLPFGREAELPVQLPPGGGPMPVDLLFAPTRVTIGTAPETAWADVVYVEKDSRRISLCVRARATGPKLSCSPDSIDFGVQRAGERVTRQVTCTNAGRTGPSGERLEVTGVQLDAPFSFATGGAFPSVGEDESFTVDVSYPAAAAGDFEEELSIETTGGDVSIPVRAATRGQSCLALDVTGIDFGAVGRSCRSPSRLVTVENVCDFPVSIEQLSLASDTGDFHLEAAVQLPFLLLGRGTLELPLRFEPTRYGEQGAVLTVLGEADPQASTATLTGRTDVEATRMDVVDRPLSARADVLLVLDNSGSMENDLEVVHPNLEKLLEVLLDRAIDFHLGVTTTGTVSEFQTGSCPGSAAGLENGRLFPADGSSPRILSSRMDAADLRTHWRRSINVGTCRDEEKGLSAAARALTSPLSSSGDDAETDLPGDGNAGFLRDAAMLQVLFVTDDRDKSALASTEYLASLRSVKGVLRSGDLLRVHSIDGGAEVCPTAAAPGLGYEDLVDATGGLQGEVCDGDWSDLLHALAGGITSGPRCFSLTARPGPPPGEDDLPPEDWFDVRVNGVPLRSQSGETRIWYFDAGARSICFMGSVAPRADDRVTIEYPVACR